MDGMGSMDGMSNELRETARVYPMNASSTPNRVHKVTGFMLSADNNHIDAKRCVRQSTLIRGHPPLFSILMS